MKEKYVIKIKANNTLFYTISSNCMDIRNNLNSIVYLYFVIKIVRSLNYFYF